MITRGCLALQLVCRPPLSSRCSVAAVARPTAAITAATIAPSPLRSLPFSISSSSLLPPPPSHLLTRCILAQLPVPCVSPSLIPSSAVPFLAAASPHLRFLSFAPAASPLHFLCFFLRPGVSISYSGSEVKAALQRFHC